MATNTDSTVREHFQHCRKFHQAALSRTQVERLPLAFDKMRDIAPLDQREDRTLLQGLIRWWRLREFLPNGLYFISEGRAKVRLVIETEHGCGQGTGLGLTGVEMV